QKFNNATQAERQCGSAFKPFIYTAAVEAGFTPDTVVDASPFIDPVTGWQPHNFEGNVGGGMMPLRSALQHSVNVVAVRLLSIVGVDKGADVVKRFGLPNPMKRVLPSALGATEEPLLDMTSAYSAFSNEGVRAKPHLIKDVTDADGNTIEQWKPESYRVMSGFVASQLQDMMRSVVTGGTAARMMSNKELAKRNICGKTGTVNDFTDAWFIGYTPSYTCGVWIGYPGLKKSLGPQEQGALAALPMWMQFMTEFLKDKPNDAYPKAPPPDREILARRAETSRAMMKGTGDDTGEGGDENAPRAKSVLEGTGKTDGKAPRSSPEVGFPELGPSESRPRTAPPKVPGATTDRMPPKRPPSAKPPDDESAKTKRGKNG
ncbi:MAG TPA: penicillin-binding transpeptidase domain-containing protein, partial [Blastocatellia bacterium]|nr:penicillin-binding transpeptidase domain-containing protein [Blastocatellia bacterium]